MAARARSGSVTTGVGVALVLMALLTVASTTLAIVANLQIDDHRQQRQQAERDLERTLSDRDRENAEVSRYWDRADTTNPVVRQMLQEVRNWRTLVGADEADNYRNWGLQLRDITFEVDGDQQTLADPQYEERDGEERLLAARRDLLEDINTLIGETESLRNRISSLEDERDAARDLAEEEQERSEQVSQEYEESKQELREQLDQARAQYEQHRDRWQDQYSDLRDRLRETQQSFEQFREEVDARDTSAIVADLRRTVLEREQEIQDLQEQLGERAPVATPEAPIRADAEVVRKLDRHHVIINIGREHGVPMGLTFEVFDADEPMPDRAGEGRGKASVEVVRIQDQSAVAQVVRRDNDAEVGIGDKLFNVVYDRDRRYNFFVHGEFDLADRGRATEGDRRRIESLVRSFRGRLMDELDYQVDYVVLGVRPEEPELPEQADEFQRAEYERQQQAFEAYHDLEEEARDRGIPVLSQNRFLTLIGYYTR